MNQFYLPTTKRKKLSFFIQVIAFVLSISLLLLTKNTNAQSQRPNVIFILGDDIGYEIPTANGGHSYETPNIDMMAAEGMRFTQCHASPLCSPSRFMLLTGKHNFRNYTSWGIMDWSQKTIGNMFKDAGYKTAYYGKWQLDGGGPSVNNFGFDNYCIHNPFGPDVTDSRYKNPKIYQKGDYVADSLVLNKYGEDIFTDSVLNFIDSNKTTPFFIYYPMVLAHSPQSPTPDDSEFAGWNPLDHNSDPKYFPSMIKYMDKKIGLIINKVKSLGLENNTVIIFSGDNGTANNITSEFDDTAVDGGKHITTVLGTHVPLMVYWHGKVTAGAINDDLVGFTDFLPTLADIAGIPVPVNNGTIDGVSFAPRLIDQPGTPRDWIFWYYKPNSSKTEVKHTTRWVQTKIYKLYDSSSSGSFYNIVNDPLEQYPLPDSSLLHFEDSIKQQLQFVLDGYEAEALQTPVLSGTTVSGVTDSSAVLGSTVITDKNYPLMARGTVYNIKGNVDASDNALADGGNTVSVYTMLRTGLSPQKLYFYKGYALNDNGFGLSDESSFYTLSKSAVQQPSTFSASPAPGSVSLQWDNAVFPVTGAKKAGYLLVYSTGLPALVTSPNGKAPGDAVSNGAVISTDPATLPALPSVAASQNGLAGNTAYNFLIVPYTWDGINASTYNYFTAGAKTVSATTPVPVNPHITSISPASADFSDGKFKLTVTGTNFYDGLSIINWNGVPLATTYVSPTILTVSVAASYLTVSGMFNITVVTSGAANESNAKKITVNEATSPLFISSKLDLPDVGNVCLNTTASAGSFTLSGSALNGSTVTIGPLAGYVFSATPEGTYTSSIFISGYGSSLNQLVYVNFTPALPQAYNGLIPVTGGGAATINISVTGSGVNTSTGVTTTAAAGITLNSSTVSGTIAAGCDSITEYGIEYSTISGFSNGTRSSSDNLKLGDFSVDLDGLSPNTKYFFKAYAITNGSTIYGSQLYFTTSQLSKPFTNSASGIFQTKFTANWDPVISASDYRLDVSTDSTFAKSKLANWTFPNNPDDAVVDTANTANLNRQITVKGAGGLSFSSAGSETNCASATGWDNGVNTKWWLVNFDASGFSGLSVSSSQRSSSNGPADFKLQYKIGVGGVWEDVPGAAITVASNFTTGRLDNVSLPASCNNQSSVFLRWVVTSTISVSYTTVQSSGSSRIDDILIASSSNLPGYNNKVVNGTAQMVTDLTPNTNYYYRVRAASLNSVSINSNTINAKTLKPFTGSIISQTNIICNGSSNGAVTVKGNGGAGTYTYSIDNGETYFIKGAFKNLPGGSYSIKIKDATGSKIDVPVVINEPAPVMAHETHTSITCNGGTSTVTITASGGTAPYTGTGDYSQSGGTTTYTVTDASGCSTTVDVTIPTTLTASETHTSINCNSGNSTVTITASGGTSPYSGTGDFTQSAGTQTYTVTDANGCSTTVDVTIPTTLTASENHTSISCNGGTSTVTITADGGTSPYSGTGDFTQSAGTTTYTVTDANGCSDTVDVTVSEPTTLIANETHTSINCNGGNSTVTITASGGTSPYNGTGDFTQSVGTTTYTVTDTNGCSTTVDVIVTEPTILTVSETHTSINCNGGTSTVTITASGGTSPYNGTGDFTQGAGTTTYTVTDANGCSKTVDVTVSEPTLLTIGATSGIIVCYGGTTTVTISATGGTPPYTGTGSFTQSGGTVTYTVTDNNGCSKSRTVLKIDPPVLTGSIISQTNVTCIGGANGSVTVAGNGGMPNYMYKINIPGTFYQGSGTFSGLVAKKYTVTVKDNNGCTVFVPLKITQSGDSCNTFVAKVPDNHPDEIKNGKVFLNVRILPNPSDAIFTLTTQSNSSEDVEIRVMDIYGKTVYQTTGFSNKSFHFGQNFSPGVYFVTVMQGKLIKTITVVKGGR